MALIYRGKSRIWQGSNTATAGGTILLTVAAPTGSFNFRDFYANGATVPLYLFDDGGGPYEYSYGILNHGGSGPTSDSISSRVVTFSSTGTTVNFGAGVRNAVCAVAAEDFLLATNGLGELTAPQVITARGHLGLGTAAVLAAGTAVGNLVQLITGTPAKLPAVDGSNLVNLPAASQPFPSGTKLLFGTSPPTGWVRNNATEDRMLKLAVSGENAGDAAGDWTISGLSVTGSTESHVLTVAEIPSHSHGIFASAGTGSSSFFVDGGITPTAYTTGITGGGGGHAHGLSTASVASNSLWRPRFEVWVAATKT